MSVTLGIPSKGRLMEATAELFAKAGHAIARAGSDRGYRGTLSNLVGIEVAFLSASEIAAHLRDGKIDAGVTGEDLLRETIPPADETVEVAVRLGFGPAKVWWPCRHVGLMWRRWLILMM
jgi:ATP phosphoribosyltransferase